MEKKDFTPEELEAARKAKNAALREWRKKNPDKVKAAQIRHFLKKMQQADDTEESKKNER